jgi:TonB-linked SusC/RagA family outer membrane protein
MRKLTTAFLLLAGLNVSVCYGQERGVPTFVAKEEGYATVKPLKEVLSQIQDTYKVNLLFDAKLESFKTTYHLNAAKDLDKVLKELLAPLMLTSVKLNEKNYVIKAIQPPGNKLADAEEVLTEADDPYKPRLNDRNNAYLQVSNTSLAGTGSHYIAASFADTVKPMIVLKGRVTAEESGEPVSYSSVSAGTKYFAAADAQGNFTIRIPGDVKTLKVSHVNYEPAEVKIKSGVTNVNVSLKLKGDLGEVTISTGMFTRRKESFTGAVSSFTGEQLKLVGNQNIIQSLKTLDPSFIVLENNASGSDPNKQAAIEIRGPSSLPAGKLSDQFSTDPNLPLFILDGFAVSLRVITDLDMNRVASVTILKDAASAAMYGAQAANGVVVIETKPPTTGKLRVTYNGDMNLQAPDLTVYNMMNATEELEFERIAGRYKSQGISGYAVQDYLDNLYNSHLMNVQKGVNTYWLAEPVRMATSIGHSLYAETGDTVLRVGFGGNYRKISGVMKGSQRNTYGASMEFSYRKNRLNLSNKIFFNGYSGDDSPYGSFKNFVGAPAYFSRIDSLTGKPARFLEQSMDYNGNYYYVSNPLYDAWQKSLYGTSNSSSHSIINNLNLIYRLSPSLQILGGLSFEKSNAATTSFSPPELVTTYDPFKSGSYASSTTNSFNYNANVALTYGKVFGLVHRITANLRSEIAQSNGRYMAIKAVGFPFASNGNPAFAYSYETNGKPQTSSNIYRRNNIVGSANYAFNNRYFVDATLRLDGSTAFGSKEKYQGFYAVGIGWNLNREGFLKDISWINTLRLRLNTGITSNQSFGGTTSVSVYKYDPFTYQSLQGLDLASVGNPDLKWQITTQTNLGTDWVMFRNKLSLSANVFTKVTDPMVVDLPIPPSTGGGRYVLNAGSLHSKGMDVHARYTLIQNPKGGKFWSVGLTWGIVKSVYQNFNNTLAILNKTNQLSDPLKRYADGYGPDDLWAVPSLGIDPGTGQEIYLKKSGESTFNYDPKDIVRIGSARPFAQGVVNSQFRLKGFTVAAAIRYNFGKDVFNTALFNKVENISYAAFGASGDQNGSIARNQDRRAFYDRWKKPGDVAQFTAIQLINPAYNVGATSGPGAYTSRFLQRDNYISGESITIGYDASGKKWLQKVGLKSFRISGTTNDLFRLSTVKQERGTDYPFANTYSFTLNASF